jgi:hypothetical protein
MNVAIWQKLTVYLLGGLVPVFEHAGIFRGVTLIAGFVHPAL